jgi:hypothetical protein
VLPSLISYQGLLLDDEDQPLAGPCDLLFSLYPDTSLSTPPLWSELHADVVLADGIFHVFLGGTTPLNPALLDGQERWLGIAVDGAEEMSPRLRLTAVPWALRAAVAETALAGVGVADGDWTVVGNDMHAGPTGNVGIGTSSPAVRLDVVGDANVSSAYRIGGGKFLSYVGENVFVGPGAGHATSGASNTFLGFEAGKVNAGAISNTFLGHRAGVVHASGHENTFVGCNAGLADIEGSANTFIGCYAGRGNTTGKDNTFVGRHAGSLNQTGEANVYIGRQAGYNCNGSGNVFIGSQAGYGETDSNTLIIANSYSTSSILVFGDFSSHRLGINTTSPAQTLDVAGTLQATGIKLPSGASAGYVLTSDASGVGTWQAATGGGGGGWIDDGSVVRLQTATDRVGIGTNSPGGSVEIAGTDSVQLNLGGEYNTGCNAAGVKLLISRYDNDDASYTYPIYVMDENSRTDFWLRSRSSETGSSRAYFQGYVGVGTEEALANCRLEVVSPQGSGAVYGKSSCSFGGLSTPGVRGETNEGYGVHGKATGALGWGKGVVGEHTGSGNMAYLGGSSYAVYADGDVLFEHGTVSVPILEITGGADLSEPFDIAAGTAGGAPEPGMVVCIDAEHPGQLAVSRRAYDRTVAGVISGAGDVRPGLLMGQRGSRADGAHAVALTGRVYCQADVSAGAIQPGDLLTTSDLPGHAMKVTDHTRAQGAILGKAMTGLEAGRGLVLVLVTLQ